MLKIKFKVKMLQVSHLHNMKIGDWMHFDLNDCEKHKVSTTAGNVFWNNGDFHIYGYKCDHETLSQYIGREDTKEVEIFDNDIINFRPFKDLRFCVGLVNWSEAYLCWIVTEYFKYPRHYRSFRFNEIRDVEIIGNRFDNFDLIDS